MAALKALAAALAAAVALIPGGAGAACRLALILALDISGSVDAREYELQMGGIAQALENPEVQAALFAQPQAPVHLMIFEWSNGQYQREVLGWTAMTVPADTAAVAGHLRGWRRDFSRGSTGLGAALRYAAARFQEGPACWRRTIDISGDGRNNAFPMPRQVKDSGFLDGITVNALVIGQSPMSETTRLSDIRDLTTYFRDRILHGPDAFLEPAWGFEDYARAMQKKLLRELQPRLIGWVR